MAPALRVVKVLEQLIKVTRQALISPARYGFLVFL